MLLRTPRFVARHLRRARARLSRRTLESLLPSGDPMFLHRPNGRPRHGITNEVVRDFDRLAYLVLQNAARRRYTAPDEVTFITYHNYTFASLLERCFDAYGLRPPVVLGRHLVEWDWGAKVRLVLEYLESGSCGTRYVVCTDADDVLMVRDPGTLLDRFLGCSCDMLFCNTFADYPPNKEYRDFETLRYYTHPLHCHVSAGGYVAEREALADWLRELVEDFDQRKPWMMVDGAFIDQLGWRHLHAKYYPRMQVDHRSLIFKRYDLFKDLD